MSSQYLDRRPLRNSDLTANTHVTTIGINENIYARKKHVYYVGVRKSECVVYSGVNYHSAKNYFCVDNASTEKEQAHWWSYKKPTKPETDSFWRKQSQRSLYHHTTFKEEASSAAFD